MRDGYVHMGLGAKLFTDDVGKNARTIFNSVSQFWSLLMLISMAEIHQKTIEAGLEDAIAGSATIYDSGYFIVDRNAETIKWLNDTLIPIMTREWIVDEIVHNEAAIEIGNSWADLTEVPNNADLAYIQGVLDDSTV